MSASDLNVNTNMLGSTVPARLQMGLGAARPRSPIVRYDGTISLRALDSSEIPQRYQNSQVGRLQRTPPRTAPSPAPPAAVVPAVHPRRHTARHGIGRGASRDKGPVARRQLPVAPAGHGDRPQPDHRRRGRVRSAPHTSAAPPLASHAVPISPVRASQAADHPAAEAAPTLALRRILAAQLRQPRRAARALAHTQHQCLRPLAQNADAEAARVQSLLRGAEAAACRAPASRGVRGAAAVDRRRLPGENRRPAAHEDAIVPPAGRRRADWGRGALYILSMLNSLTTCGLIPTTFFSM